LRFQLVSDTNEKQTAKNAKATQSTAERNLLRRKL
jgi:hypothetical protein